MENKLKDFNEFYLCDHWLWFQPLLSCPYFYIYVKKKKNYETQSYKTQNN